MTTKKFSLGGPPTLKGAPEGGFSLTKKTQSKKAITDALPGADAAVHGDELPVERETREEMEALQAQFKHPKLTEAEYNEKKRKENQRRETATEYSYYAVLVFSCNADLNKFIEQVGVGLDGAYYDGYEFAAAIGKPVTETKIGDPSMDVLDMWDDLALSVPEAPPPTIPENYDPDFE